MPYRIIKSGTGFKVSDGKGHTFSNKALTKKQAEKQRISIALSESRRSGKPVSTFFY